MAAFKSVHLKDKALSVIFKDGTSILFEDFWLRDHCRCSTCYLADTFQRAHHLLDIPEVDINSVQFDSSEIEVTWSDNHESTYKAEFLIIFEYTKWINNKRMRPFLWRGNEIANKIPRVHVDKFLNSVEGAETVFKSLLDYGVAFVDKVDVSMDATEVVCKALGGIQHTFFGGMWQFTTVKEHADTAYTNLPLAVHNDNTYFSEAGGLQILHCLEHSNGVGGETILADGFYGASQLKKENPEDFEFLTSYDVEAEYLEEGLHFRHSGPVIEVDKLNDIKQIRYNAYDRSPMAFSSREECRAYYRSYKNLSSYYENPEYQWKFKLQPGLLMIMDNFRVLHGRTGFTGTRILCGTYVSRSDWLNKARQLRLIY